MATLTKENFDVYVDNKLDNTISVYKLDDDRYIVLLKEYTLADRKNMSMGVYYLNITKKKIYMLINVRKLEIKDEGKSIKINKSSMEDLSIIQIVDNYKRNLKITDAEIRFTPHPGLMSPDRIDAKIHKKEVVLKRVQSK